MINPFKSKKGLGRGLSSLIGDSEITENKSTISISSIVRNKYQPRKKIGHYKEILPMIVLLSSSAASMMNGCCVPIDGGESLNYDGIF